MARPLTWFLSDIDGALCVACRMSDTAEPRYVVSHYATQYTAREFCREFDLKADELRARVTVVETMPGEYAVTRVWECGGFMREGSALRPIIRLSLKDGGRTMPVAKPRIGKGSRLEWDFGRWRVIPPKGKPRMIDV